MFQNNAEKLLESHLKFAHPIAGGSNNDNKPEKFPRPELKLDSSAEEWSEFLGISRLSARPKTEPEVSQRLKQKPRNLNSNLMMKTQLMMTTYCYNRSVWVKLLHSDIAWGKYQRRL